MATELHYDVLVVGAGNAALTAAVAALEQGARVGVLEKAPKVDRGGNSYFTGHMRFPYNSVEELAALMRDPSPQDLARIRDELSHMTEAELWDQFMRVTNNKADQEMLEVQVSESYNTVRWLVSKGHDWIPNFGPRAQFPAMMNGGGFGLGERNFRFIDRDGGVVHYETAATELLQDNQGAVIGVRAITPQGFTNIYARSVVLACGGFEGNPEMRTRYLGPAWDTVRMRGVPFNTGDGLRMALDIGAMSHGSWSTCHASPQDVEMPESRVATSTNHGTNRYMFTFSIMVNNKGERFVDEADDLRSLTYAKMGRAILAQPDGVAYQIADAKVRRMELYPSIYDQATGAKADTLEKLAEELAIDPRSLVETVRAYNAALPTDRTAVPDRYKLDGVGTIGLPIPKSNFAISIVEPPFEGYVVRCGITFTFGGLKIQARTGQVQHVAGRAIPGLYAAGEIVGGLFHGNYPSGSGMMAGANWGRISGTTAAQAAMSKR